MTKSIWFSTKKKPIQVYLFQRQLLLLTHNMKKDCLLNYKFNTWKLQAQKMLCAWIVLNSKKNQFVYTTCAELVVFLYWTRNSMNNLSSGLVDARISASDKDLPVLWRSDFCSKKFWIRGPSTNMIPWSLICRKSHAVTPMWSNS